MASQSLSRYRIPPEILGIAAIAITIPGLYFLSKATIASPTTPTTFTLPPTKPTHQSREHRALKTFHALLDAYATRSPSHLCTFFSPSFRHIILPSSLNLPSRTLDEFQPHAHQIFSLFSDFTLIPQPADSPHPAVHYCASTNTVVAHCKMGGKVNGEGEMGGKLMGDGILEWWNEGVWFVEMEEEGEGEWNEEKEGKGKGDAPGGRGGLLRVKEIREFVDSKKAAELKVRLQGVLERTTENGEKSKAR
ncbi:hypothetical protein GQ43DRAFT_497660 [Delitschia confertaspora ATCC 74209]|uniref:Uncharacterized protein n=1 Tax=Delitschia confertaspora ATCC 74209 TaxID=1513339 RepID=A0A9P4JR30_9PLEO|nr:hypothetical protein GQ43DRAFT_497660 [Delitschia confertaspora ATCC 74209]